MLATAGFRVHGVHTVGSNELASGWLLGFGSGDLTPEQLADAALVRSAEKFSSRSNALYIASGMIGVRMVA